MKKRRTQISALLQINVIMKGETLFSLMEGMLCREKIENLVKRLF